MSNQAINSRLNEQQLDILKLFSRPLPEDDLIAIRKLIKTYLAKKVTEVADAVWEDKNWDKSDMERILNTHDRTPYNPNN